MGSRRRGRRKGKTPADDSPPPAEGKETTEKSKDPSTPKGKGKEPDEKQKPKVTLLRR